MVAAWWNSLETVTILTWWLRWIGGVFALIGILCTIASFATSKHAETIRATRDADRRLAAKQSEQMLEVLRSRPTKTIEIGYPFNDPEGLRFAEDIAHVLTNAGWQVSGISAGGYAGMNPTGLIIAASDANDSGVAALRSAFDVAGFKTTGLQTEQPNIVLIIGPRRKNSN